MRCGRPTGRQTPLLNSTGNQKIWSIMAIVRLLWSYFALMFIIHKKKKTFSGFLFHTTLCPRTFTGYCRYGGYLIYTCIEQQTIFDNETHGAGCVSASARTVGGVSVGFQSQRLCTHLSITSASEVTSHRCSCQNMLSAAVWKLLSVLRAHRSNDGKTQKLHLGPSQQSVNHPEPNWHINYAL